MRIDTMEDFKEAISCLMSKIHKPETYLCGSGLERSRLSFSLCHRVAFNEIPQYTANLRGILFFVDSV